MKRLLPVFLIVFVTGILTGCGYTTRSTLAGHLNTIHVEAFDNKIAYTSSTSKSIYFPLLEVDIRNAIIDRILFDGNLKIADAGQSDLVLKGELIGYEKQPLRFTDGDDVEEYRIHVIVSLKLWDNSKNALRWSESRFVGESTYFVRGSQVTSEESAVNEAIADLARRIVERTVEDW